LYIPPEQAREESMAGFWALEFKTTAASEFDVIKAAGVPKEEHIRRADLFMGIEKYQSAFTPGAIIYYENW
jgi:hypothetical protein